jgi:Ni/Fe-hydrogenase subunit HybB-like protein
MPSRAIAGYAAREPTQAPPWHGLVAWDVFFNALTTGLFLAAAVADLAAPSAFAPVAVWAYPFALCFLLTDLVLLVIDLGNPARFHHMLRVFKPSSPMSLGTWCLAVYSLPLTALVAVDLIEHVRRLHLVLVVLALPFAFGSMIYKGVLFSTSSQPGWRDARWFGAYHATSALAIGAGLLLAMTLSMGRDDAADWLRPALALLILAQCLPMVLLAAELRVALANRYRLPFIRLVAAIAMAGVLFPLLVVALEPDRLLGCLSAVVLLAGGWVVRAVVIALPQPCGLSRQ